MSYQSHWKRNLISLIVIIIVVVGVVIASLSMQSPRVYTITIFNDQETVNAYTPHPFSIPPGASNSSVSGTFTAQGGSDNDIKVYIIDSADFWNYTNNNDFSYLYYSGQIHTASFSVNLSSGDYYLLLDNKFAALSYQKLVNIQMNATYTK